MSKIILIAVITVLIFSACSAPQKNDIPAALTDTEILSESNTDSTSYIDKFIFLGESTTYHLKNRGVLSGGRETLQVWGPKSGTLLLEPNTSECRIIYPETKEELEFSEALKRKKPEYLMLTFGLNGATNFISRGSSYFKHCYKNLIDTVKQSSKNTVIIINSCFPVAENMNMQNHTVTAKKLNEYIETLNVWAEEVALENGAFYINTASTLKNENGFLKSEYQTPDGFHLNSAAYIKILEYINKNPVTK